MSINWQEMKHLFISNQTAFAMKTLILTSVPTVSMERTQEGAPATNQSPAVSVKYGRGHEKTNVAFKMKRDGSKYRRYHGAGQPILGYGRRPSRYLPLKMSSPKVEKLLQVKESDMNSQAAKSYADMTKEGPIYDMKKYPHLNNQEFQVAAKKFMHESEERPLPVEAGLSLPSSKKLPPPPQVPTAEEATVFAENVNNGTTVGSSGSRKASRRKQLTPKKHMADMKHLRKMKRKKKSDADAMTWKNTRPPKTHKKPLRSHLKFR